MVATMKRSWWQPKLYVMCSILLLVPLAFHCKNERDSLTFRLVTKPHGHSKPTQFNSNKIAIIGAGGYIGSYITKSLSESNFTTVAYDSNIDVGSPYTILKHSNEIVKTGELNEFGVVVFLGGCTGRESCTALSAKQVLEQNVHSVRRIIQSLGREQHFIAASTSAILEGNLDSVEGAQVNESLLDAYSTSMYEREKMCRELINEEYRVETETLPKITLLRFGTVVGNSPGQRIDLMIPSFFTSAYTDGVLRVNGHEVMRSFLSLEDLSRAIHAVISSETVHKFNIWHLASFSATVLKIASTIASITGASIDADVVAKTQLSRFSNSTTSIEGFSLDSTAFETAFNFKFEDNLTTVLRDFDTNVPEAVIPKGAHALYHSEDDHSVPCPICKSTQQQLILNLGRQPLANDFRSDLHNATRCPTFPLKLVRCELCNHYHLSTVVNRGSLFNNYIYQSGTSSTLGNHFKWLAQKVVNESGLDREGSILEIACNDGSQLDHFKAHGWRTYGIDPAVNLVSRAAFRNHTVRTGFWPSPFPELPTGDKLTAITAQNVAAHVPDVVAFLKGCAKVMGPNTKLYVQTSQCNMQQLGQFDTVYHEHVSFFTGHSFLKASELSGLTIISFETIPIHGESCLVTMQLAANADNGTRLIDRSTTLQARLSKEVKDGITSVFFAKRFAARAHAIRDWLSDELLRFESQGFVIGAYGAAAKGMVLLHFMMAKEDAKREFLDFVLDDAPLKQNMYCPGTSIPVKHTKHLCTMDASKPILLVLFAWNFYEELSQRVGECLRGKHEEVILIVPFPTPKTVRFVVADGSTSILRAMPFHPTHIPNPLRGNEARNRTLLITHQRNEEMLIPFFIIQHAPMFDHAILIDYNSTDRTRELIERFAPPTWNIVPSTTGSVFDATETDEQVMFWEKQNRNDWAIALTTTEFLVKTRLREYLYDTLQNQGSVTPIVAQIGAVMMADYDQALPLVPFVPLPKQRNSYVESSATDNSYSRFLHIGTSYTHRYTAGRHEYVGRVNITGALHLRDALILKWLWAPWPESIARKTAVGDTIPVNDVVRGFGKQHTDAKGNVTRLLDMRNLTLSKSNLSSFCTSMPYTTSLAYHRGFHDAFGFC